jgi:hypothetical protein
MEQWYIIDGKEGRVSRSGTWVYASKSIEIYNGLTFKIENSVVKIEMTAAAN